MSRRPDEVPVVQLAATVLSVIAVGAYGMVWGWRGLTRGEVCADLGGE